MPRFFIQDKQINTLGFLSYPDDELLEFMRSKKLNPNHYWAKDNPLLHLLLANERFRDFGRFLQLTPEKVNPNLCDGTKYGRKSLLILLTLLISNGSLPLEFLELYKARINFAYQDSLGRTALHYAVILGRSNLIKALLAAEAPTNIADRKGFCPFDYLNCDEQTIIDTLKMIDIEPSRDVAAKSNNLRDHKNRNLIFQGGLLVQNKSSTEHLLASPPVLFTYIPGAPRWGACIGDDSDATHDDLTRFAAGISESYRLKFDEVFVKTKLSPEEHQAFLDKIKILHAEYTDVSVLQACSLGHDVIKSILDDLVRPIIAKRDYVSMGSTPRIPAA